MSQERFFKPKEGQEKSSLPRNKEQKESSFSLEDARQALKEKLEVSMRKHHSELMQKVTSKGLSPEEAEQFLEVVKRKVEATSYEEYCKKIIELEEAKRSSLPHK